MQNEGGMTVKKRIVILCVLLSLLLLVPIPSKMKDGGTVHYNAILYDVYDVHRLKAADASDADGAFETEYIDGIIVKVLGFTIFNNVESACEHAQDDAQTPYFVGKVLETNEKGFLALVTDTGNGSFAVGETVQVNTDLLETVSYDIGDCFRISFDGKVALSYPPQVMSVTEICKTDKSGACVESKRVE